MLLELADAPVSSGKLISVPISLDYDLFEFTVYLVHFFLDALFAFRHGGVSGARHRHVKLGRELRRELLMVFLHHLSAFLLKHGYFLIELIYGQNVPGKPQLTSCGFCRLPSVYFALKLDESSILLLKLFRKILSGNLLSSNDTLLIFKLTLDPKEVPLLGPAASLLFRELLNKDPLANNGGTRVV
jgi:hypothetical protein